MDEPPLDSPSRQTGGPGLTRFRTNSSSTWGDSDLPTRTRYPNYRDLENTNNSGDNDTNDVSHYFQGLPQPVLQSPSRAALRYSPERRHRSQFYRDSRESSPVHNRRYEANLQESPLKPHDVIINFDNGATRPPEFLENLQRSPGVLPEVPPPPAGYVFSRSYDRQRDNMYHSQNNFHLSVRPDQQNRYRNDEGARNISGGSGGSGATVTSSLTDVRSSFDSQKDFYKINYSDQISNGSTDTFTETKFELNHPVRRDYVRRANSEKQGRPTPAESQKRAILKLDNPIPGGLLDILPRRDSPEFTEMRYTACTAEPDDFLAEGYSLRLAEMNRECQIVICITMYNENKFALARTMHSIMRNIAHLCSRKRSPVWGPNSWKKVSVILVSDGRAKVNQGSLDYLAALGVYQEDMAKASVNGDPVKAHIFELTTQISINADLDYVSKNIVPVQLVFCLKEENKKKINSHRWLFNAFCPILQPTVAILVDVGTRLNDTAVYHLWKAFDNDSNVAGAAGQIKTIKGVNGMKLLNPLVASQNFEYKISNILDKPLESVFGYISVLPGALSAYRYRALQNHADGTGPLHSYFLGETQEGRDHDVFTANMYLAEDRILCWELVAKRDAKWVLKYVKEATGATDVPEEIPEFISQRRRWLNGAMFAALYAQLHFYQIWKTKHSFVRKFFFHIEFIYQGIQMLFSWFSIANFVLTFYYLAGSLLRILKHGQALFIFLKYLIFCDLACLFIISMGNRPQGGKHLFITSMVILTICALYSIVCGFLFAIRTLVLHDESHFAFLNIVVSMLATYGCYVFASFMYLDPWHIFTSSIQYFLTLPAFTCTLQIFAFCNTHDVSWGTKGSVEISKELSKAIVLQGPDGKQIVETDWPQEVDKKYLEIKSRLKEPEIKEVRVDEAQKRNDYYRDIRTRIVMFWMLSNLILIMSVTQAFGPERTDNPYLIFILWSMAVLSAFRVTFSMAFLFMQYLRSIVRYINKSEINNSWDMSGLNPFHKE